MSGSALQAAATAAVATVADAADPVLAYGTGVRQRLEAEGWSPTMAEQIAANLVMRAFGATFALLARRPAEGGK